MDLLVTVPAAVEDALASLMLDPSNPTLQQRGAITYIRRLYHPYLLGLPSFAFSAAVVGNQPSAAAHGSGSGGTANQDDGLIATSMWLFEDPAALVLSPHSDFSSEVFPGINPGQDDSPAPSITRRTRLGALLLLGRISALPAGLRRLEREVSAFGVGRPPLTLHIVLVAGGGGGNNADDATALLAPAPALGPLTGVGQGMSIDASLVRLDDGLSLVCRSDIGEHSEVHPETAAKAAEQAR